MLGLQVGARLTDKNAMVQVRPNDWFQLRPPQVAKPCTRKVLVLTQEEVICFNIEEALVDMLTCPPEERLGR